MPSCRGVGGECASEGRACSSIHSGPSRMVETLGVVSLVGAGPGDPGLITVKGLQRLREADVVAYDRLVDRRLLEEAREVAELIDVGKQSGQGGTRQRSIYPILIDRAHEGKRVVRLKGGDPFVFGRGGEEAQVLAMAGIPFEVVPGVTSAVAAPAYAGIPLTHREAASSFTVVSAVEDADKKKSAIPWGALARTGGTLVVMMGWGALPQVVERLLVEGMTPSMPAAVVQWGTEPYQKTVVGALGNIVERARAAKVGPPVVVIVGRVVELRNEIRWYEDKLLFGKRVLVTRSRTQASVLSRMLTEEGAEAIEVPTIEIAPPADYFALDEALKNLKNFRWVVFTSVNGVAAFFHRLNELGKDARALGSSRVCAIGPITASALEQRGVVPDFKPPRYTTERLVQGLSEKGVKGVRVLMPRTNIAPEDAARALEKLGAEVHQPVAYRTLKPAGSAEKAKGLLGRGKIDIATFTSSSTVQNLLELLDGDPTPLEDVMIACIGPVTARKARELGLEVDVVARRHTVAGLVQALKNRMQSSLEA